MSETGTIFLLKNHEITTEIMGIKCLQLRETLPNTGCIEKEILMLCSTINVHVYKIVLLACWRSDNDIVQELRQRTNTFFENRHKMNVL